MFGTMGISELIIILVIVLIIFGAGKLPQIGEGVGKALRGFKKEVNDIPSAGCGVARSKSTGTHASSIYASGCTGAGDDAGTGLCHAEAHRTLYPWAGTNSWDHRGFDAQYGGCTPASSAVDLQHSPVSANPIGGAGSTASNDGRASGCSHARPEGTVPASSGQRPNKTGGETAVGHCQQRCCGPCASAAGIDEGEGCAVCRYFPGGYAELGGGAGGCVADVQAGRCRCPQFSRSRDPDHPSRDGFCSEGVPAIHRISQRPACLTRRAS